MTRSEKINLAATIIGPAVLLAFIAWISWSFNARMTIDSQAKDAANAEKFVAKSVYDKNQDETNRRLEIISGDVAKIQQDVAVLRGQAISQRFGAYGESTPTKGAAQLMQGKEN